MSKTPNSEPILFESAPTLVAHRGYSGRYPENTLLAYQAAYQQGARFMECDIQLSADRVPFVHHDANLQRIMGVDADIRDTKASVIKSLTASYTERFADEFIDNQVTTFRKLSKWLARHPDVTMFVELKQESIDRFGVRLFVDEMLRRILEAGIQGQCVMISFNSDVIDHMRKVSTMQTGWVLPAWNDETRKFAQTLSPEFLFCDVDLFPLKKDDIWSGSWQWALYNLDDIPSAIAAANLGVGFLETNQIGALMKSHQLNPNH